jgi:VWFA-related protein
LDSGSETERDEVIRRATAADVEIYGIGLSQTKALLTRGPQEPQRFPGGGVTPAGPPIPGRPNTPDESQRIYEQPIPGGDIISGADDLLETALRRNTLAYYSRFTGGAYFAQWSPKVLQENLNAVATDIASQYELAYVPDDLAQTGFHRITVRVNKPGVKVRARAGYYYLGKSK